MNGTPRSRSACSRSGWRAPIRIVARRPRMPAPTTPAARPLPITPALLRSSGAGRLELRRDLLVGPRDHFRDLLDALREDGNDEIGAVGQSDAGHEVDRKSTRLNSSHTDISRM